MAAPYTDSTLLIDGGRTWTAPPDAALLLSLGLLVGAPAVPAQTPLAEAIDSSTQSRVWNRATPRWRQCGRGHRCHFKRRSRGIDRGILSVAAEVGCRRAFRRSWEAPRARESLAANHLLACGIGESEFPACGDHGAQERRPGGSAASLRDASADPQP